jgi:hypothetical protein
VVFVGGKHGYIDRGGKIIINPQFNYAGDFSDGLAFVCLGECNPYSKIRQTTDGSTKADASKYGFVDGKGHFVVNPQYDMAAAFSEGLAAVCLGNCHYDEEGPKKWGFVDRQGDVAIPLQFGAVKPFTEGLAAVCVGDCTGGRDGKWGFIDTSGHFVISPQFDEAYSFESGAAQVRNGHLADERIGYIDKTGKFIWNPTS